MKARSKSYTAESIAEMPPKIKTLDLLLAIPDPGLEDNVKTLFDLAKSAGQELNVTFTAEETRPPKRKRLRLVF